MTKGMVGWRNLWQLVFLAASILSSSFLLVEVQGIQIELHPKFPVEGQEIQFIPKYILAELLSCNWYRGQSIKNRTLIFTYYYQPKDEQINGPASTGRETGGPDCILRITNLSYEDAGGYAISVNTTKHYEEGYATFVVSENLPSPLLESSSPNGIVAENSNDVLNCRTSNHSDVEVFWSKDGEPLPAAMGDLSNQNRTLTLSRVAKSNTGTYRCMAKNSISHPESNPIQIIVTYGPQIKLNPEGTIYKSLNSELIVECIADSYPEPKFQWFFNDIQQAETGSILQVRLSDWKDGGPYTCKATNPFTNQTDKRTGYVILTNDDHLSKGVIAEIVVGCLAGVALVAGLLYFIITKTSFRRETPPAITRNHPQPPAHVPAIPAHKKVSIKRGPSVPRGSHAPHASRPRGSRSPSRVNVKERTKPPLRAGRH